MISGGFVIAKLADAKLSASPKLADTKLSVSPKLADTKALARTPKAS